MVWDSSTPTKADNARDIDEFIRVGVKQALEAFFTFKNNELRVEINNEPEDVGDIASKQYVDGEVEGLETHVGTIFSLSGNVGPPTANTVTFSSGETVIQNTRLSISAGTTLRLDFASVRLEDTNSQNPCKLLIKWDGDTRDLGHVASGTTSYYFEKSDPQGTSNANLEVIVENIHPQNSDVDLYSYSSWSLTFSLVDDPQYVP